jgi:triosephosphate isomerase
MNLTASETERYFDALLPLLIGATGCDLFVLPPFTSIWVARERLPGSRIAWGGQDVHAEKSGAYTGDVSAAMLVDLGCTYVEVGHPERRRDHGETDELVAAKVAQILRYAMTPILCVSEPTRRSLDATIEFVLGQVAGGLARVRPRDLARVVVAYEPGWAIGLGAVTASPDHVGAVHMAIHHWLEATTARDGEASAGATVRGGDGTELAREAATARVIYGGSVTGTSANALLAADGVDGLFVGRAALDPAQFAAIVEAGQRRASGFWLKKAPADTSAAG